MAITLGAGAAVAGVLIAAARDDGREHHHGLVFTIVFAAVAAVLVGGLIAWRLRGQLNRPAMQQLRAHSYAERRATMHAVNKGRPLTDGQREIARAQLDTLRSTTSRIVWLLPLTVLGLVLAAITNAGGLRWVFAALAAFELLSLAATRIVLRRQVRRLETAVGG